MRSEKSAQGFIRVDPLADHPNQIGMSPYSAFWNNPIRYDDPDGRCPSCDPLFSYGLAKGLWSGVQETWSFITSDAWKAETWEATGNLLLGTAVSQNGNVSNLYTIDAALGTNTVEAMQGLSNAVDGAVDKLTSGNPIAQGEVVGEALWGIAEGVVGSKGVGVITKSGKAAKVAGVISKFSPANPGPLPEAIAKTFRGASYSEKVADGSMTLYRAYGGKAGELGNYWTRTKPTGPLQSTIDSALDPAWGNTAENVSSITIPKGTKFYEGAVAPQGNLVGGGSQIYIPKKNLNPNWLNK